MKNLKKLIHQYDAPDTLIMVSLYPKKGELYSAGVSGLASYAKNIVTPMNRKVVVLADYKNKPEVYEEDNVLVIRCFKTNTMTMWKDLFTNIQKFSSIKEVLIQFDFAGYGSFMTSGLVVPFMGLLKSMNYRTSIILHHVVLDVFQLAGHVGLSDGFGDTMKGNMFNAMFHTFYYSLGKVSDRIIVLEETLKNKLAKVVRKDKIVSIPHGVDNQMTPMPKYKAREELGMNKKDYVILFFGFVNWFKGADLFAEMYKDQKTILNKKVHAIIAGGESSTLKNQKYYQKYFNKVTNTVCDSPVLSMTGYVPQEDIEKYFSAADLIVFPYRHFMTASGVLSLVFSYQKPFIISSELSEMFDAKDFSQALKESGLKKSDLTFDLNQKSCIKCTEKVLVNGLKKKMVHMAKILREKRDYSSIASLYEESIFNPSKATVQSPVLALNIAPRA